MIFCDTYATYIIAQNNYRWKSKFNGGIVDKLKNTINTIMDINNMEKQGYVYILTNPSFKEDWVKIGKSAVSVEQRVKQLDGTAVPLPFEIYATLKTSKYSEVEKLYIKQ